MEEKLEKKLFVREEGNFKALPNPPSGWVTIGTHRTGGGGHRWYAYAQKGACHPEELISFFKRHPHLFGGGMPYFEVEGKILKIYSLTPGGWIGKEGRWIRAIQEALIPGYRVKVIELFSIRVNSGGFLPEFIYPLSLFFWEDEYRKGGMPIELKKDFEDFYRELLSFIEFAKKNYLGRGGIPTVQGIEEITFLPNLREEIETKLNKIKLLYENFRKKYKEIEEKGKEIKEKYKEYCYFDNAYIAFLLSQKEWFSDFIEKIKKLSQKLKTKIGIYKNEIYYEGNKKSIEEFLKEIL